MQTSHTSRSTTRLLAHGLLVLAGLGAAFAVQAQTATLGGHQAARVDNRQERQDTRIDQGVASGELTRPEQARMEVQQARIGRMENRIEADGKVSGKEALRLERKQDQASRSIARNKHDRQDRPAR